MPETRLPADPWPAPPADLEATLAPLLAAWGGELALAVHDRTTGETWALGDGPKPAASLIKVGLAIAALQHAAAGRLDRRAALPVPALPDDDEADFDNLGLAPTGRPAAWDKVLDRMLTESDNAATNAVIDVLGLGALEPVAAACGLANTVLRRRMLDAAARAAGRENLTTAADMVRLLTALLAGELLDPLDTATVVGWLGQQRSREKLARGLPATAHLAHKTGEVPGFRHDAGWVAVDGPTGGLVVAALATCPAGDDGPATDHLLGQVAGVLHAHAMAQRAEMNGAADWLATTRVRLAVDLRLAWEGLTLGWDKGKVVLRGSATFAAELKPLPAPIVDAVEAPPYTPAVASVPCLQLRAGPGHARELVSQARWGDRLEILEPGLEWARVRTADGYIAFAKSNNIVVGLPWSPTHMVRHPLMPCETTDGLRMQLSAGTQVVRGDAAGTWQLAGGPVVKVAEELVQPLDHRGTIDEVLAFARKFLGLPYLWGGTTAWGIDCSGLAQLCYQIAGVALPRDADMQQEALPAVPLGDLRAGDLAFFPGHVALMLDATKYLHATAKPGRVTINSFDPAHPAYDPDLHASFTGGGRSPLAVAAGQLA